jgi:hypothetical protein
MERIMILFSKYERLGVEVINMLKYSQAKEVMMSLMENTIKIAQSQK